MSDLDPSLFVGVLIGWVSLAGAGWVSRRARLHAEADRLTQSITRHLRGGER